MRYDDYNRAENACRVGLALTIIAVLLNALSLYLLPGNTALDVFGVAAAVLSMTAGYFADSVFDSEFGDVTQTALINVCIWSCVASYAAWFLSMLV